MEETFAAGDVLECILADTHTHSTKKKRPSNPKTFHQTGNTLTKLYMHKCKHTETKQTCRDTHKMGFVVSFLLVFVHTHTHNLSVWAGCGHSRCCP